MHLHEIALFTDNVDRLADFYQQLLNTAPIYRSEGLAIFPAGSATILIHRRDSPGPEDLPCENHFALATDQLDQTVADCTQRGLTIDHPPRNYDWGRSAYLRDPDGHLIELHQTAS